MKPVLSKPVGWILLAILVFSDAFLDVIRGAEGNPLWKPIIDIIGIKMVPLLVPVVLVLLYLAVKILGWIVQKTDKTPKSEELILTVLVVVYGVFDIWLIAVDFFGFTVITDYRLMIIPLTIVGMIYGLWAQKKLKTNF
ncbi:MAG: hypothetical protein A3C08_01190 [Candidatus Taylorbacteria bacterium RIFCSPHIGHO2_02_FULL_47_18]|nr:MAG: hypothetical protein A2670_02510 [Candidatus Taylorbacteria bacterium RIFCSPHIGHO2_01_FULL_48_38]OHA28144.1 MAG: hypothetical protein A3C08_01190 [Candidatus Taylorbacteria bacterium RIFCSPHIGHO2_02_FULL_47_18]OHA40511.1 MAG: hypothetical protein A3J31_00145 [Candidatus Taylorbacteria bacterium RIFCSPLOWO2_02_FULL_48_16]OHA45603.1 MAG: hypothetical protein A3H13_00575 [Candidatus Taylorbacteria bacterium RIFCSPLOWO2_12_FULL_48_11]